MDELRPIERPICRLAQLGAGVTALAGDIQAQRQVERKQQRFANIPLECREAELSALKPGETATIPLQFREREGATRVEFNVMRPTGFSTITTTWTA